VDAEVLHPTGQHLDHAALDTLADAGWPVVRTLPGQMELFDARLHDADGGDVVQLSYSDGLSTLSLFVQNGELPGGLSGRTRTMGGSPVLVSHDVLERVVWSGGGHTWTLVSDAPESVVDQAVVALPHATPRPHHDGLVPRVWRGMSRVGSWLNPFE
jgi:negative regulator of sigma E activity